MKNNPNFKTTNVSKAWRQFFRALISNDFDRRKNDPVKDRKALETYISLRGYKNGEIGNGREKDPKNGNAKLTLEEIAKQLGTSKTNLTRVLRIERDLTDSMKGLSDTGKKLKHLHRTLLLLFLKKN